MSQTAGEPLLYALFAVLVHSGGSCHAGHYFCYTKVKSSFLPNKGKMCAGEDKLSQSVTGSQGFGGEGLLRGWIGFVLVCSWFCSFLPVFSLRNCGVHLQVSMPFFAGQQWTVVQDGRYVCGCSWHRHSSQAGSLFAVLCQVITSIKMCSAYVSFPWLCYFSSYLPEYFSLCHRRQFLPASFNGVKPELPHVSRYLSLLGFRLLPWCKLLLVCYLKLATVEKST